MEVCKDELLLAEDIGSTSRMVKYGESEMISDLTKSLYLSPVLLIFLRKLVAHFPAGKISM